MCAKIAEGDIDYRALPEIRPSRPFAKTREKSQQLEQEGEAARKRREQLRNEKAPAAPIKAASKASSDRRVNTLHRMTAEAAQHRKSEDSAAAVKRAETRTRERAANAPRHRHAEESGAAPGTKNTPAKSSQRAENIEVSESTMRQAKEPASTSARAQSAKNGKG